MTIGQRQALSTIWCIAVLVGVLFAPTSSLGNATIAAICLLLVIGAYVLWLKIRAPKWRSYNIEEANAVYFAETQVFTPEELGLLDWPAPTGPPSTDIETAPGTEEQRDGADTGPVDQV